MNHSEHFSRAERIQRIGELLSWGVTQMLEREARSKQTIDQVAKNVPVPPTNTHCPTWNDKTENLGDDTLAAIAGNLRRVGSASPRDIQLALDFSKATAFRRLQELVQVGAVIRTGQTKAIRYHLDSPGQGVSTDCSMRVGSDKRTSLAT